MTELTSWGQVARLRYGFYRSFAASLLHPNRERLAVLEAGAAQLDDMGVDAFAFASLWWRLRWEMVHIPSLNVLASEYVRLFASGVDGFLSPPIESYYLTSAKGGDAAMLVSNLAAEYRRMGLVPEGGEVESDHLVTELEALAVLCRREAECWAAGDVDGASRLMEDEAGFLIRHPTAWLPAFRERIAAAGALPFYVTAVEAMVSFVAHDLDLVRNLKARLA